jgi:hypothetical protein
MRTAAEPFDDSAWNAAVASSSACGSSLLVPRNPSSVTTAKVPDKPVSSTSRGTTSSMSPAEPGSTATNTAVPDERICSRRSSASPSVSARSADESTYTGSLRNASAASATGSPG